MNLEKQIDVIEMLARHEEAIKELYKAYAEKFPNDKEFWLVLSQEESGHANLIHTLHAKLKDGSVSFDEDRFRVGAIGTSLNYVQRQTVEAKEKQVSVINALVTALDIEKAMIEKEFFTVFEVDSVELKNVLSELKNDTKSHRDKIEKALAEHR